MVLFGHSEKNLRGIASTSWSAQTSTATYEFVSGPTWDFDGTNSKRSKI